MKIHIPTPLRSYTGGLETVSISGTTVNTVFDQLTSKYPDLKQHLFTPEGKLRSFVNVYLNDDDIRYLDSQQETAVKDTDELTIIPSIAGGTNSEGLPNNYRDASTILSRHSERSEEPLYFAFALSVVCS
jgi:adenylyltransferase/sulfurtransferase